MKKLLIFFTLGLAVAACTPKTSEEGAVAEEGETPTVEAPAPAAPAAPKTAKDFLPSKSVKDSVSYLLGINFGSFIKGYDFGEDLNYSQIIKGMKDFLAAKGSQRDPEFVEQFKVNPNEMNRLFDGYLSNRREYKKLVNKEKEDKFLAENAKKEGMVVSATGLQYRIADPGNDVKPGPTDTVWVRYKGTLIDGTVFDQVLPEAEAVHFTLNRVVPGWSEGLQYIGEGGHIELYVPAKLGYGENGNRDIAPNSTLIFDVQLEKVGKVAAE